MASKLVALDLQKAAKSSIWTELALSVSSCASFLARWVYSSGIKS
jgi:hypothetical protein